MDELDDFDNSSDEQSFGLGHEDISYYDDGPSSSNSEEENVDIAHELLSGLNQFRESELFCDITLKAGDILIPAHKVVLCACSPYFSAMFSGQFRERNTEFVVMEEINGIHLRLMIDYIYTGKLNVNPENVRSVLEVANFLQINSAQEICCEMLSKEINEENCLEFIEYAGKRSLKSLLRNATKCAAKYFCYVTSKEDFSLLEFGEIDTFLQEDELSKYADDTIFSAIHRWIDYAPKDRLKYLPELLVYVNPAYITKDLIKYSEFLKINISCEDWILETKKSVPSEPYVFLFNRLGHYAAEKINMRTRRGAKLKRLPQDLCQSSYTAFGSTIFVQGGWISRTKESSGFTAQSYSYNAYKGKWTEFIPLTVARANHRSCVLAGSLYNVGGAVNLNSLPIVERLDLITGQYISAKNLQKARSSFGLVVYENCMYVIGGNNGDEYLSSIERYDPREGFWKTLSNQLYSRGDCSSAVFEDNIYCSIGPGGAMERFDVKTNQSIFIKTFEDMYPREIFTIDNDLYGVFHHKLCKYSSAKGKWDAYRRVYPYTNYLTGVPMHINA